MNKKWYSKFFPAEANGAEYAGETAEAEPVTTVAPTRNGGSNGTVNSPINGSSPALGNLANSGSGVTLNGPGPATLEADFTAAPDKNISFGEIYKAAQIRTPDHGYSVLKIVDMLDSEFIRNLSTESRRCSLLMALEAVRVGVDDVVEDAQRRQRALSNHEAVQQKIIDEFEARKAKENSQLQAEMERVTNEYLARMKGNSDEVARHREQFRVWQIHKSQEVQRIANAVSMLVPQAIGDGQPSLTALLEMAQTQGR